MSELEKYLLITDEPKYLEEFYRPKINNIDYARIIEQFQKLLGVFTTTQALSKVAVLMREESETETELNRYKNLMDSIYEIVSVECMDVGETFAGIKDDIDELRQGKY